jgi:hypothetical protein
MAWCRIVPGPSTPAPASAGIERCPVLFSTRSSSSAISAAWICSGTP